MPLKYFIKTFGCQQNYTDSKRISLMLEEKGMVLARNIKSADHVYINTCMVRQMAENRIYGLVNNLKKQKSKNKNFKIIVTGCLVGMMMNDKTGKYFKQIKKRLADVDEFLPIEEVGFDHSPLRVDQSSAFVAISNGCNNFCSYCVVPYSRGSEVSRPIDEIVRDCKDLASRGVKNITLLGMNVNSYGADIISSKFKVKSSKLDENGKKIKEKSVYVKHLGRHRIPTLFPYLLETITKIKNIKHIDFLSSNPWDFSDELIKVIAKNPKITRTIHLPVQSGSNRVLKKMNRWYTRDEYLKLVSKLKSKIKNLKLSTDIIVGFCGETEKDFQDTVDLCKKVGFEKAYISRYSPRPLTKAYNKLKDDVSPAEKKRRWRILDDLVNKKRQDL